MNKYFETLFKFVDKHFILIAIFLTILNIYFFTKREEYFTTESKNVESSKPLIVYEDCDYKGLSKIYGVGEYKYAGIDWNNKISSLKVAQGYKVTFYEDTFFQGKTISFTEDDKCLVDNGWNDKVTGIKVEKIKLSKTESKTESRTEGNVESRTEGNVESRTECRTENRTENRTEGNVESRTECRTENRNVESKPWNYVKMYIYRTDPRDDLYNIYSKLIENKTNAEKKSILRKWERKIKKHLQGLAITLATATERLRHSTGQKKDNLDDRIERWTSRIQQLKNTKIKIQAAISKISSE